MLIAGVDEQGSHLFQTCPSGNLYEHIAAAIGARSQASKTYLERNVALRALREASTDPLTDKTCSVAVVGSKDTPFRILSAEELTSALEGLDEQE
jgi:20S proteasome subunit alpha 6